MKRRRSMIVKGRRVAIEYSAWKVTGRLLLLAFRVTR
jgi:hypothetical protein